MYLRNALLSSPCRCPCPTAGNDRKADAEYVGPFVVWPEVQAKADVQARLLSRSIDRSTRFVTHRSVAHDNETTRLDALTRQAKPPGARCEYIALNGRGSVWFQDSQSHPFSDMLLKLSTLTALVAAGQVVTASSVPKVGSPSRSVLSSIALTPTFISRPSLGLS